MEPKHRNHLHYVLIPSEPEHFCLDKIISEAGSTYRSPLGVSAEVAVWSKFGSFLIVKCFTSQGVLRAANRKNSNRAV